MAEQTSTTESLDGDEVADRLEAIASAFRNDEFTVTVGNKRVALRPPETINYHIGVTEKQNRFRGNRETVRIELDWKPE